MNRRQFCQSALNLGLFSVASSLLPWRSFAQNRTSSTRPAFFVLVRIDGGWDTSLSTDPWVSNQRPDEKDYFIEYRADQLLPFAGSFVGPALKPLQSYFNRMTIINGIFMTATDGGHDSNAMYASTGNGQGDLGVFPLELEGRLYTSAFGTMANQAPYSGNSPRAIWDLNDIIREGNVGGADLLIDFNEPHSELAQARNAIMKNQNRIDSFNSILSTYKERSIGSSIATGFRAGLSSSAYVNHFTQNLDTHSNHEGAHLQALTTTFEEIRNILDVFQTSPGVDASGQSTELYSLLDQTTFMLVSEFTRTPALNGSKGKDHNPQANSAIVLSPQLKNMKIGEATVVTRAQSRGGTSYLAGLPLDLNTQQVVRRRENSFILRPENVVATVAKSLGVEPSLISKNFSSTNLLTSIIK